MDSDELKNVIQKSLPNAEVSVQGDGRHFEVVVISDEFQNLSLIQRQRMINQAVQKHLLDGSLHAIQIRAFTKAEVEERDNG